MAEVIFCEDTRVTRKLLKAYEIDTKTRSFHAHSGEKGIQSIVEHLTPGTLVALVTDAGMPTISDPGARAVAWIKEHLSNEVVVTVIPGPDAITTALAGSGTLAKGFRFLGFLPTKKGRQTALIDVTEPSSEARVLYESTHRIIKLLEELEEHNFTDEITIARELTKLHEDFLHGRAGELIKVLTENPKKQRGEFVVILHPKKR
jgi:16S rRNA (cytidine1402-2'-O)-methyltransferase